MALLSTLLLLLFLKIKVALTHVWLFATPWTIQSMRFSRPEYWSGVTVPFSREIFPTQDRTQVSCIAGGFYTIWVTRETLVEVYIHAHQYYIVLFACFKTLSEWYHTVHVIWLMLFCSALLLGRFTLIYVALWYMHSFLPELLYFLEQHTIVTYPFSCFTHWGWFFVFCYQLCNYESSYTCIWEHSCKNHLGMELLTLRGHTSSQDKIELFSKMTTNLYSY